jgi:hypothetical protein
MSVSAVISRSAALYRPTPREWRSDTFCASGYDVLNRSAAFVFLVPSQNDLLSLVSKLLRAPAKGTL